MFAAIEGLLSRIRAVFTPDAGDRGAPDGTSNDPVGEGASAVSFPRKNNVNWLLLLFASKVLFVHAGEHLEVSTPSFLNNIPGVPAFFFFSGFLIYASYMNAAGGRYAVNRSLRLLPGLVAVTLGGMGVALVAHGWQDLFDNYGVYASWAISQVTLGQAFNPSHFRDVGVGAINGSLWTLTTQILFYASVPIIVYLEKRFRHTMPLLTAMSFAVYVAGPILFSEPLYRDKTLYDIIALTPIAWGWMFGFGMLAFKYYNIISRLFRYFPILILPLAFMAMWGEGVLVGATGNRIGLFYFASYAGILLFFAFNIRPIALQFDLSYGVYIWHMPIINLLLVLAVKGHVEPFWYAFIATYVVAALSWFVVEKPALRLKPRSLHPQGA
jgi:peptidoglycan/LPS O-acetylase OafA/YrhL